nr:pyruvate:ferredoxin (flavodoxin) oxidoreductase [Clostridia bacterium]
GMIKVRLYRPFSARHFLSVLPETCRRIAVLDRTKEPGATGEPLLLDVKSVLYGRKDAPLVIGGRYGLASKDTTPGDIAGVFENLARFAPKEDFTLGIIDDVTQKSIRPVKGIDTAPEGLIRCKFWGLGSDGTVGANKSAIKIIGDNTDMYAQGYFEYDSKKSGGITISHLRFGKNKIQSTYYVLHADYIACHNPAYLQQYDMTKDLRNNGKFVINCVWDEKEVLNHLTNRIKKKLADAKGKLYIINAVKIGEEIGLGNRINMIMQATFFALADVMPIDEAIAHLKDAVVQNYGMMGDDIVQMNYEAIERGAREFKEVPVDPEWSFLIPESDTELFVGDNANDTEFVKNILRPISHHGGDLIPVSIFKPEYNGIIPPGTAAYEKRGVAFKVPEWHGESCIQCNICSFSCPHSAIRPVLVSADEAASKPAGFETVKAKGKGLDGFEYRVQISPLDCLGCGVCVDVCPTKDKGTIVMTPIDVQMKEKENWEYAAEKTKKDNRVDKALNVKNLMFSPCYFEFSGACAGCGETPYANIITRMFGDSMMIANATGCSSIWGASFPSAPYTTDCEGRGPAWGNSLFEDNAEFGLGMAVANKQVRTKVKEDAEALMKLPVPEAVASAAGEYLETFDDRDANGAAAKNFIEVLESGSLSGEADELAKDIIQRKDYAANRNVWIFGGDGWAYDIGYGGLDHVLASGENVNVLVFDTEVYSNTGGQSSKATPAAAIAQFAAAGKRIKKKDLGLISMSYGYVYVAQVALGADRSQFLKAVSEAAAYDGPSLIIAYSPCINHGIKTGMNTSSDTMKKAVEAGYWHLYRYNPDLKKEGKNPFILDSKEPKASFRDFILNEVRFSQLTRTFPDTAEELFTKAEEDAKERYRTYKNLAESEEAVF